ncbi:MazG nucleotide pyrophosphohydrolase domain-containing protein [Fontivita pretiosa]|uniref:MazG nucleotide pyrophosphohydrolase domain-containing protein n=1 Tax=Fontivita pretiosa TaxID=2989684 RepID=UPI003D183648
MNTDDPNRAVTIADFQRHISERYEKVDRQRGWPKTFAYFIEEVGELATALSNAEKDRANLEEEFADVIAWLCTLANITDVDLARAITKKYLSDQPPQGHK